MEPDDCADLIDQARVVLDACAQRFENARARGRLLWLRRCLCGPCPAPCGLALLDLVTNGVAAGRLTTKGFGPNEPLAPNNTAEGRAKNRRVDFKPTMR